MAKYGGKDVKVFLADGMSLLASSPQELSDKTILALGRSDGLGAEWDEHTPTGRVSAELSQSGAFYDDDTNNIHEILSGQGKTKRIVNYGFEGNAIGARIVGHAGVFGVGYERLTSLGSLHKANVDYTVSEEKDEGVILHALGAETADGDTESSSVDNGASSANGAAGYLQVTALTLGGYTSVTGKIRHSADDIAYADLITFDAVTTAPGAQRKTVTGTVNQHLASSWAFTGAGSNPSITFLVAAARG